MSEEKKNPLTVIQPQTTALAQNTGGSSWGDEDEQDYIKPRYLRIKQKKTVDADDIADGLFWDKETGKTWEEITLVLFNVRKTRKLQTPYKPGTKSETLCRSSNRKVPVTTDDRFTPKAVNCDVCPYGQRAWANYKNDKIKPANPCEQEIEFFFIMPEDPIQPYILVGSGKGRSPLEEMWDSMRARSKEIARQPESNGRRPEIFEYEITMSTAPGSTPTTKEFFYPVYDVAELSAEEAEEKYGEAYKLYVSARQDAFEAAQAQATDEAVEEAEQVEEVEAEAKPVTRTVYAPPPSRRKVGSAVKPTYVPPTIDAATGDVVTP